MATKIRLGYDILAKRAIETESGINIDDALRRIHSYEMVGSTGEDKHPDVPTGSESGQILYVTKPDHTAWIWSTDSADPGWICIGGAGDSWKTWSEEHGSTADGIENAVYIGPDNDIEREDTFILGDGNTVKTTDDTDYSGTEVITIGLENTATNAAIAYQLGRHNSITGNNLANKQQYPNQLSMNLGDSNVINGEGINIGKCNTSTGFGITLGQNNTAQAGSLVLGSGNAGGAGSVVVGKYITLNTPGSILYGDRIILPSGSSESGNGAIAFGSELQVESGAISFGYRTRAGNGCVAMGLSATATGGGIAIGKYGCTATNGGLSIGENSVSSDTGSISIGKEGSSSGGGIHIGNTNTANTGIAMGSNNTVSSLAIGIGYSNTTDSSSYGIGRGNNATRNSCAFGINNDSRYQSVFIGYNNTRGEAIVNSSGDGIGLAIGNQNILTNGAFNISLGQSNEVGYEAIALGNNNHVYGWSAAFGFYNSTTATRGSHTIMLGSYNTSLATLEYIEKNSFNIYTYSLLAGTNNTANHYNSFLIGAYNTSFAPEQEIAETDDDGFVLAIGLGCAVGRNYDFAYGYQSMANGGENTAIQHSSAIGYRNLAMIDSLAVGTSNVSLVESAMSVTMPDVNVHCARNFLFKSTLQHSYTPTSNDDEYYGANDNIIAMSTVNTTGQHLSQNIFLYASISGTATVCESNIVLPHSSISMGGAGHDIRNNILMNNSSLVESAFTAFWNGDTDQPVAENILAGTTAVNSYGCFSINDIGGLSNGQQPVVSNSIRAFNFGDNIITNTVRITAFGGKNSIIGVKNAFVKGEANTIESSKTYADYAPEYIHVFGSLNKVKLIESSSISGVQRADRISITGCDNTVQGSEIYDIWIHGSENKLQTPSPMVTLTGAQVHTKQLNYEDVTLFQVTDYAAAIMIRNDSGNPPTTIQFAALWLYPNSNYAYFVDDNVLLRVYTPNFPSITYISMNIDTFINNLKTNISSLNHKFYKLTGYSVYSTNASGSVKMSSSIIPNDIVIYCGDSGPGLLTPDKYYYISGKHVGTAAAPESSGTIGASDTNIYCSRDRIFGFRNNIQSNVTDFTIFGNDNIVSNEVIPNNNPTWAISHGFVQGNNNEVKDGSNIICMGNGNVSTGHNSVAIGCQLISNQWQTVIGKYNTAIDGPNRLASETPQDSTKALLIVGNGYSTKDDKYWQDETYITRSNALELYADGRLKITGDIEAANIPAAPVGNGSYALTCDVTNGVATYRWVPVGLV